MKARGILAACAAALSAPSSAFGQCALCRDAVQAAGPEAGEAFSAAILLLVAAPYVVGGFAFLAAAPGARAACARALRSAARRAGVAGRR